MTNFRSLSKGDKIPAGELHSANGVDALTLMTWKRLRKCAAENPEGII